MCFIFTLYLIKLANTNRRYSRSILFLNQNNDSPVLYIYIFDWHRYDLHYFSLTVPLRNQSIHLGNLGNKYGSRSFVRTSANLWNSPRGERAAWLKNSPTVESFMRNLKTYLFCER